MRVGLCTVQKNSLKKLQERKTKGKVKKKKRSSFILHREFFGLGEAAGNADVLFRPDEKSEVLEKKEKREEKRGKEGNVKKKDKRE